MNKKLILSFILAVLILSCTPTRYAYDFKSTPYGMDLSKGIWLIDEVESPLITDESLNKIIEKALRPKLEKRLIFSNDVKKVYTYLSLNPEKWKVRQVKKQTGYDYFINIDAKIIKDEVGSLGIGKFRDKKKNVAEIIMEIYDLNTGEIIYYQKLIGSNGVNEGNDGFTMMKDVNMIIKGGIRRLMKKLE